ELGRTTGEITETAGVRGEILVRAPHVRDRYLMLWGTTHESMRFEGWHATGDVGHLDDAGRLWVEGRAGHVLATAGGLYTPVQVEEAAETVPTVRRAGAAVVGPRGTQQVVVILETEEGYRPGGRPARPRPAGTSLQDAVPPARALPPDAGHHPPSDGTARSRGSEQRLRGGKAAAL